MGNPIELEVLWETPYDWRFQWERRLQIVDFCRIQAAGERIWSVLGRATTPLCQGARVVMVQKRQL